MGLTHDRDPTMMCDLSGRLLNVPPVTMGERVRRRIVRKLLVWRPAPANPPTPSRDLTTHVGTSLERRAPRQRTPRVRSDRVISVSHHVWVSMETDRIDRWRFGSVVVDEALVRGARGLMALPDGDYVAVQRIPSSDLAVFVNRAVDGMLPSPGDPRNICDGTFPVSQDESGDKANPRNRLFIQSPTVEEKPGAREPPDDLRTLWIEYDAHGDLHKAWRDITRKATFEIYKG